MEWVSVDDRLPEFSEWVIIYRPAFSGKPVDFAKLDCINYNGQNWINSEGILMLGQSVDSWMPLPEPPKDSQ